MVMVSAMVTVVTLMVMVIEMLFYEGDRHFLPHFGVARS